MLSLTIPVWLLVIIIVAIVGLFLIIKVGKNGGGAYDFFTPLVLFGILFTTIAIIVGIILGKFIF